MDESKGMCKCGFEFLRASIVPYSSLKLNHLLLSEVHHMPIVCLNTFLFNAGLSSILKRRLGACLAHIIVE